MPKSNGDVKMIHVEKAPEDLPMSDELYDLCVIRAIVEHAIDETRRLRGTYCVAGRNNIAAELDAACRALAHATDHLDEAYAKEKESEE